MKTKIILPFLYIAKGLMKLIYAVLKLFPAQDDRILFCSRQSNDINLDFRMIQEELRRRYEKKAAGSSGSLKIVTICNRVEGASGAGFSFLKDMLRSMYHMSRSRVLVIDTYWPPASMLHHKKSLRIIQIWHSIGKIKKSGKITTGTAAGRDASVSKALNMHENNDYIIAGGKAFDQFYYDSFGEGHYELRNYGLPRIDYMLASEEANRARFFAENPQLMQEHGSGQGNGSGKEHGGDQERVSDQSVLQAGKLIILYAPTFRRGMEAKWTEIIDAVDPAKYILIIKNHPSQRIEGERPEGVYYFDDWTSVDLLAVADYVITDYSAIALEAAVLDKKTCYWVYDYDEYMSKNGLNVDMYESMPGTVFQDIHELMKLIDSGQYPMEVLENYRSKYLPEDLGHSTEKITDLIMELM